MPDIKELGRKVKAKYPGKYDDLADDDLGRRVKAKYPGAYDDFTDAPARQPEGVFSSFQTGVAGPLLRNVVETAADLYNAPGETLERAGRAGLEFVSAFDPAGAAYEPTKQGQAERVAELNRRADERLPEPIQSMKQGMAIEEAKPRTRAGRIAGVAGSILGEVAFPTAPETAVANIVTAPFAGAAAKGAGRAFKAGVNAVRRTFGKGAAQIIEAEALPAARAQVQQSLEGAVPAVERATVRAETASPAVEPSAPISTPAPTDRYGFQQAFSNLGIGDSLKKALRDSVAKTGKLPGPERNSSIGRAFEAAIANGEPRNVDTLNRVIQAIEQGGTPATGTTVQAGVQASAVPAPTAKTAPSVQQTIRQYEEAVDRISRSNLSPEEKGKALEQAIESIARSRRPGVDLGPNESMVQSRYPRQKGAPQMVMPDNPNPIQQRGNLPGETDFPPLLTEAEFAPQSFGVKRAPDAPYTESVGPSVGEAQAMNVGGPSASVTEPTASAPLDLNAAVASAAEAVPSSFVQRAKDELLGTLGASKSLRSTADISYPLRQGALLLLRPLQWRQAGKVWKEMFRAFRTKNFDAIKDAIENHPLAGRMDGAGLYRGTQAAGEEAFAQRAGSSVSKIVSKTPIIKQSEQAYTAAADTQRVQAFEQYARLIDKAKLSPEEALKADKAAAQWINIATGRGSLGQRIDKAFDALNLAFFSPRYIASRLNVFNPAMYIRNASSPGGRVVLKQQMSDLMQFASVVATTMYLAKQAGADVGLNINSPDFLKIRVGNWRYDTLAGLQQVMRLIYRVGADVGRAGRGEKPKPGQTATDIAETFLSYKLSPPAGVFRDFINQRTVDRKPFTAGRAIADLTAPMQWADFVEAYQKEAWGGVLKASPGFPGIGAQNYEQSPVDAAIEKSQPLFTELQRLNKRVTDLRQKDGEKDDAFDARVRQFGQNYTTYGLRLLNSPRFQAAPDNVKAIALDSLNNRAKAITSRELALPEIELDANTIMDAAESSKKNPANK